MLRENLNTATRSEQMMTNTGTEHSVSSDTPSLVPAVFAISWTHPNSLLVMPSPSWPRRLPPSLLRFVLVFDGLLSAPWLVQTD